MAIINVANRALESRDNSAGSQAGVDTNLPTSVKALAGFIVILGVIVLGIAAWKIGKWRRSKLRAASKNFEGMMKDSIPSVTHVDLSKGDEISEKPTVIEPYKWRPISRPPPVHSTNKAVKKGTKRFFGGMMAKKPAPLAVNDVHSPPPSYAEATPVPPAIVVHAVDNKSEIIPSKGLTIMPPSPDSPLPSPMRVQSIGPDSPLYKSMITTAKLKNQQRASMAAKTLPRLMAVVCTFTPSLGDELGVSVGEPLVLLEEYEDEWCLVQRVGKADAERGVIPRFCLQEAPRLPNRRASLDASRAMQ
ncbi:hypothetical protein BDW22DRAFT_432054 [Trametopsis cervina]|nr:hypothetical protein BDW22DRAFT_432054 [Trametopsis cervina]